MQRKIVRTKKRPLRILTNMRLYTLAGIAQYVSGFIAHNENSEAFKIFGIDIVHPEESLGTINRNKKFKHFRLLSSVVDYPPLGSVNQLSQGDINVLRESFKGIIEAYTRALRRIKPDIVLINGSYYLPWCLMQAAEAYRKATIVMHYHGILKKEVAHWPNTIDRALMLKMEKGFDQQDVSYIFPSKLAQRTVEREVFGHRIARATVLPNPVAPEFFEKKKVRGNNGGIGVVSRWTKVKNMDCVISMAKKNVQSANPIPFNIISDLRRRQDMRAFKSLMRFKKPMANAKLVRFYSRQGVIISPSTFETYGNVAQEAIASGTPALVSPHMGVAETFRAIGLSDWIIEFSSPARALKKAKSVATTRVPHSVIARLREEYSSEPIFSRYTQLLSEQRI